MAENYLQGSNSKCFLVKVDEELGAPVQNPAGE